eukprot:gb/GECG01010063.1/.p1 GENE.gb/GECG01010063.1/~~gb/GECG01010063.1/.p1  ORF type:complete len:398 (+),score=36.33 gb/GECG01010063.1/:1-1194(+)
MSQLASRAWPQVSPNKLQSGIKSWKDVMLACVCPQVSFLTQPANEGLRTVLSQAMGLLLEYVQQYPQHVFGKRIKRTLIDHFLGTLPLQLLSCLRKKVSDAFLPNFSRSSENETVSDRSGWENVRSAETVDGTDEAVQASDTCSTPPTLKKCIGAIMEDHREALNETDPSRQFLVVVLNESTMRSSVQSLLQSAQRPSEGSSVLPARPGRIVRAGRRFKNMFTVFRSRDKASGENASSAAHFRNQKLSLRPRIELVQQQNDMKEFTRTALNGMVSLDARWSEVVDFISSKFPVIQQLLTTKLRTSVPASEVGCQYHLLIFPDVNSSLLVEPVLVIKSTHWIIVTLDRSVMEMSLETINEDPLIRIPNGQKLSLNFLYSELDAIGDMTSNCFKLGRLL